MSLSTCGDRAELAIRRIPFPYKAMLAICSDLDETQDLSTYLETARYLNTNVNTAIGQGVGLEVGNTIYFDMPYPAFSYWNTDDRGREIIHAMIASGHIDCIHSYGDLALRREHAGRALESLTKAGGVPKVWVDHAVAPTNFGRDIMRGEGDVIGSTAYHADLTCGAGVKYLWMGRVTSILGQDVPRSWTGLLKRKHPCESACTLLKEGLKAGLAFRSEGKYRMHSGNELLRERRLRDGQKVLEFIRSNPHWAGVSAGETWGGIPHVLNDETLRHLVEREAVGVIYTHLGKGIDLGRPNSVSLTCKAFETLARWCREKKILVTTTFRLLSYMRMVKQIKVACSKNADVLHAIEIESAHDVDNLQGLTVYVDNPAAVEIVFRGSIIKNVAVNGPDDSGCTSFSIPWRSLTFPMV